LKPHYAQAHSNLGTVLLAQGNLKAAEASFRAALAIDSGLVSAYINLGTLFQETGQISLAQQSHLQALRLDPSSALVHINLGAVLQEMGEHDRAIASCRRALELRPGYADAQHNLLFTLNYHPDLEAQEIFAAYREYDELIGRPLRSRWRDHGNLRDPSKRLRVGYVSPDFRQHSVRHFLEPLLTYHDERLVEVFAYAEVSQEDAATARYRGYVDHWIPTIGLSDEALAERVRSDRIDILVDLAGHTAKNRLGVFARKPAPVSISWLGYGYTTGLSAIDYMLTDDASAPPGSDDLFAEQPWRLRTPGYAYRAAEGMGPVSELPAYERGFVTFGTLTRSVRINHRTVRVWSQILDRVPRSRLVVNSKNYRDLGTRQGLLDKFAAHGIAPERLDIGFHSPPWDVLRGMDIGLDCFPHNSGTTLFESLYMGVPFVTLAGRPTVGRLGSSILEGVGHSEWIAHTEAEYAAIAAGLANDLPGLAALRGRLRVQMQGSPLMDEAGFTRNVEAAYREMFSRWVQSSRSTA
jgi:predicted O-linked N-acetylglucosamine transferase (SPINDLY family)